MSNIDVYDKIMTENMEIK